MLKKYYTSNSFFKSSQQCFALDTILLSIEEEMETQSLNFFPKLIYPLSMEDRIQTQKVCLKLHPFNQFSVFHIPFLRPLLPAN